MSRKPLHVKRFRKALERWTGQAGTLGSGTSTRETTTTALTEQAGPQLDEGSPETADIRADMHHAIDMRDIAQVRECLRGVPQLKLWLHPRTKESAMHRAVKKNSFKSFGLLLSQKCEFKNDTEGDCLEHLNPLQQSELARQRYFVAGYEGSYISVLKGKSTSVADCAGFQGILNDMYRSLDSNDLLKPVLKVASMAPHLNILFDFQREHTQCMVGGCRTNLGMTEPEKESVFIGAKGLDGEPTDATKRRTKEVEGTLIHELCHLALNLVYGNGAKPYLCTDGNRRQHYASILEDASDRQHGLHEIIRWAFQENGEAELIVRIPHILALCPTEGNTILEEQVPRLFQFFKQHIVEDMTRYIQDGCLGRETEVISEENGKLGKASSTEKLGIEFMARIDDCILLRDPPIVLVASNLTFLEVMVNDLVRSARVPYLFLEASQWGERTRDVLIFNKCSFLLLSCEGKGELRVILNFSKELHDVTGMKIILLTSKDNLQHCLQTMKKSMLCDIKIYLDTVHTATFENVTDKCKNKIIKRSRMALQSSNQQFFIRNILNIDRFSKTCQEETFLTLCREGVLYFGPELKELQEDVSECYINQKCGRSVEVDLSKLMERRRDDAFAFLGCSKETLQSFLPKGLAVKRMSIVDSFEQIVLMEQDSDYDRLVATEHYKGKTVHLFEFCEGRCRWKRSNGALSHLPMTGKEIHSARILLRVSENVLVVSGDPGAGKTVLATRLCTEIKKADKKAWVLYVSTYPKRQEAMKLLNEETGGINFKQFAKLCCVKTSGQEFELFQQTVTEGSPFHVWVIFDALDETLEMTRKYILEFTKVLARDKLSKILIFTRTICRNAIQDEMHLVPFDMAAFSEEEQDEFLQKYQQSLQNPMTDKKTFKSILNCVKEKDSSLLGNPLILRMVAEVDQGEASDPDYCELVQSMYSSQDCFTLLSLYRLFVEYKYLLYRIEKKKEDRMRAANEDDDETLKPIFQGNHALLALKLLLPEDALRELVSESECNDLKTKGRLITAVKENKLKQGIIVCLTNDTPQFVHHSFAEFFAADLIFKRVKEANARGDVRVARIVSGLYGESSYVGMLTFLDGFAAERHAMQSSIMNNDIGGVIVEAAMEHAYSQDALERTPLHVAALHANQFILNYLSIDEVLTQQDMLGMTPLMYADKIHAWERLDAFCARSGGLAINWFVQLPTTVENITSERDFDRSVLGEVLYERCKELLSVLLREFCNSQMCSSETCIERAPRYLKENVSSAADVAHTPVNIDRITDDGQRTPLHISIIFGDTDIVRLLLPYSSPAVSYMCTVSALFGHTNILRLLLPFASSPSDWYTTENRPEGFPLPVACLENIDVVELLLPHFLTRSPFLEELLYSSILHRYDGVTKAILPNSDARDRHTHQDTASLYASVRCGCLETVRLMLPYIGLDAWDKHGITALCMGMDDNDSLNKSLARREPQLDDTEDKTLSNHDIAITKLLLLHLNIDSVNIDGGIALRIGMKYRKHSSTFKLLLPHLSLASRIISEAKYSRYTAKTGEQDILRYLIPNTPINTPDENGHTPLLYCFLNGYLKAAKLLLPLTVIDDLLNKPLRVSVRLNYCEFVELVLPHSFKSSTVTVLLDAVDMSDADTNCYTKLLLPHVDVDIRAVEEKTAWCKSVYRGNWASVQLFLPYTERSDGAVSQSTALLLHACKRSTATREPSKSKNKRNVEMSVGDVKILKLLLLDMNLNSADANRALSLAQSVTNIHAMKLLRPHASVSKHMLPQSSFCSSISVAEFINSVVNSEEDQDILRSLIPNTPINTPDENGYTPLLYCCLNGYLRAAKILLPLTVLDSVKDTPFFVSASLNKCEFVELLLPHCFKRSSEIGFLAAVKNRHGDATKLLLPHVDANDRKWRATASSKCVEGGGWASVRLFLPYTEARDRENGLQRSLQLRALKQAIASIYSSRADVATLREENDEDINISKLLLLHSSLSIADEPGLSR
ncbi:uncharacterized protein LOC135375904 isoform X2 [Ornithodoros turicata]